MTESEQNETMGRALTELKKAKKAAGLLRARLFIDRTDLFDLAQKLYQLSADSAEAGPMDLSTVQILISRSRTLEAIAASVDELATESDRVKNLQALVDQF